MDFGVQPKQSNNVHPLIVYVWKQYWQKTKDNAETNLWREILGSHSQPHIIKEVDLKQLGERNDKAPNWE